MFLLLVPLAQRETINFDFAWRFAPATDPRYGQCTFEKDVNFGKGYIWTGDVASYQECCNECSNRETCLAWDWNGRTCWVKDNADSKAVEPGRWAGRLPSRWPDNTTVPAQAAPAYNDSAWELVDAPHDMGRSRQL